MEKPIIEIKNIGKKYKITHERGGYIALRDVLMNIVKSPFSYLKTKAKSVAGLEKKEDFWALKDVNLTVNKGEVIGIIGRNGAGKSTLLKILSQITPPTEGEIIMRGTVGSLLEVGTGFHPELTGRENIFLNGAIIGMKQKEIAKKFDQIVEFAGIEKFLDTPVKYYSSGMYVRLAFSVAAHMEPDILIIDEVLAVGDAEFQQKCLGKMEDITKREGRTILFVSHNMGAIKSLCTKTVWIDNGKIKMFDETNKVINSYSHENEEFRDEKGPVIFSPTDKSKDFIFNKIWITDDNKNITNTIPHNEDFNVNLEFNAQKETNAAEISMVFKNTNGVNITFTSLSDSLSGKNFPFQKGRYTTTTKIEKNFLMPDIYIIRISAHERNFRNINTYENAMEFKIVDVGSTMAPYGNAALSWSCVLSKADWKIEKNENK